jgi:hypothetical protein
MSVADWVDDICQYLEDQGVGIYSPTTGQTVNIFIHHMRDTPVNCICLEGYAGRAPAFTHDGKTAYRPNLQIMARAGGDPITAHAAATALLDAARAAIDDKANTVIGSHTYMEIRTTGEQMSLGYENGVIKISQNYITERK